MMALRRWGALSPTRRCMTEGRPLHDRRRVRDNPPYPTKGSAACGESTTGGGTARPATQSCCLPHPPLLNRAESAKPSRAPAAPRFRARLLSFTRRISRGIFQVPSGCGCGAFYVRLAQRALHPFEAEVIQESQAHVRERSNGDPSDDTSGLTPSHEATKTVPSEARGPKSGFLRAFMARCEPPPLLQKHLLLGQTRQDIELEP
jgi:hypothetical protein